MTGKALLSALLDALQKKMPGCEVREAFAEKAERVPKTPAVVLELIEEVQKPDAGIPDVKLGASLYAPPKTEMADLFAKLCAALGEIGAPVRSVTRERLRYDKGLGCLVAECVVRTGERTAGDGTRESLTVSGERLSAKSVKVTLEEKRREYGAVGEEVPHTVRAARTYTVRLNDVSDAGAFRFGETFELECGGMRYTGCTLREKGAGSVVLSALHAEKTGEADDGGV